MESKALKILMIDDDEDDFVIIQQFLNDISDETYQLEWASSYEKGVNKINKRKHDIYLIDYRLGSYTGLDLLNHFHQIRFRAPVIMLTGKGDFAVDQQAMEAGAADYLVKGEFNATILERSIRYAMEQYEHLKVIEENERKYFNVFEKSLDLILLANCDNMIIDINPTALSRLGYTKHELLKKKLDDLFYYNDEAETFSNTVCDFGEIIDKEYVLKTKQEEKLFVRMNVSMQDADNQIYQCIMYDISRRKQVEDEKRQNEKFAATGRIARVIAHEVRNPLTNIGLALNELKENVDDKNEDVNMCVEIIERNCVRINQLITELLNSTRFLELNMQRHNLHELLGEVMQQANDRMQLKKISLNKIFVADETTIMADKAKISIAFLNLIMNAIEAMQENDGVLTIRTEKHNNRIVIKICDTGPGIDKENLDKIFEPFFTTKGKGNGLGLTNTQNIILTHRGSMQVESEIGKGTRFIITLPIADRSQENILK